MRLVGRSVMMEELDIALREFVGGALLERCDVGVVLSITEFGLTPYDV